MRSMMLAATLALTAMISPPIADACGGPYGGEGPHAPTLFLVTAHHGSHTFVLFGGAVDPSQHEWRTLDADSFDRTQVAIAPDFRAPVELTLLGPSGTKQVTTRTQILVKDGFTLDREPTTAAQVPNGGDFRVAVHGKASGLVWRDLARVDHDAATRRWAHDLGIDPRASSISRDDDAEMISYYNAASRRRETRVRVGQQPLGTLSGWPIGTLTADGIRYVAFVQGGRVHAFSLGATATPRR